MAKKKAPSKHSRAARRETSPGIDTDKSLKDIQPPKPTKHRPSVLAAHQSAGVTRKQKLSRRNKMSAKARKRHEKGLEMAEAVIERTSRKKEKSFGRSRTIQERAKGWDDINKEALAEELEAEESRPATTKAQTMVDGGDGDEKADGSETDEEMDPADNETPVVSAPAQMRDDDDDDEIL